MASDFERSPAQPSIQQLTSQSALPRRRLLQLGLAGAAMLMVPAVHAKSAFEPLSRPERSLSLLNLHTGERVTTTYWVQGQYLPDALSEIDTVLRDHRSGAVHSMDTELLDVLYTLQQQLNPAQSFHVISGFRSPATNAGLRQQSKGVAKRSYHMQGKAIDIRLPGCALSDLRKLAVNCRAGGVGYYPKSDFIHVDTGPVRRWG